MFNVRMYDEYNVVMYDEYNVIMYEENYLIMYDEYNLIMYDVRMYADDSNLIYASNDELLSFLISDRGNLKQWFDPSRLSLHVVKTKCLFTGTRHRISLLTSHSKDVFLE